MKRVSSRLLLLVLLHLLLVLVDGAYFYHQMTSTRDDAQIINYAGVLRGSMQRLAKLAALGQSDERLVRNVDELMGEFERADEGYAIGMESDRFKARIDAVRTAWDDLRLTVQRYGSHPGPETRRDLLLASEVAWDKADQAVFTAQAIAEQKWSRNMFGMGLLVLNLPLLAAIFWIVRSIVRGRLEYGAAHDELTGAYNRFIFNDMIKALLNEANRYGRPFSYLVLDLDHFKRINDNYGHGEGDSVLRKVVQAVNDVLRGSDMLFRIGGEEFIVLLPEAELAQAAVVAEKIRALVERTKMDCGEIVTVSLGVTEFRSGDGPESLFNRADKLLFLAKKEGRNRFRQG
ncbi:sensor domain-containing diguanylate cyclase [Paucidesulfovibrio longus]|uniref:sensor domain-containing diguanylate cyclase n=1 Tax=Paucidesulfovibrio longus TaxID=889 RepID=UPI0003B6B275|nr:diguanylate cyclase [Paucidesulfovibrio longus]